MRPARPCASYLPIPVPCWHNRPGIPAARSGGQNRRSRNRSSSGVSLGGDLPAPSEGIMDLSKLARHPGLKGRSVFVTGGGSGIGAAIVEAFVDQGAKVAFVDINAEVSEKLVADLKAQYGNPPLFIKCDLKDIPA